MRVATAKHMARQRRDILERCIEFSDVLLDFVEHELRRGLIPAKLLFQARDAGTSVGAHNAEAQSASTRRHLLTLRLGALREAREAQYWLELIRRRQQTDRPGQLTRLAREASELVAIHTTIVRRLRGW